MNKIYEENHEFIRQDSKSFELKWLTNIEIQDIDTLGAAQQFKNPVCLNFASHKRPGGGYKAVQDIPMPIKTQEEDLFRRSNLPVLMDTKEIRGQYPLKGLKGIYTSNIMVNKDAKLVPHDPYEIALVTVPAVVNPKESDKELVQNKIKRILEIAADHDHDALILGAWGCGIFNNDPKTIASLFQQYLTNEFSGVFQNVIFAIPGKQSQNYKLFEEVLK